MDTRRRGLPWVSGATDDEAAAAYACDGLADDGAVRLVRAVSIAAPPAACFLWLCQLRRAPYSYDLIDNFGRRSPRVADPSLIELEAGQAFMTIFNLTAFVPGRSVTLRMKRGWPTRAFGDIVLTYEVVPAGTGARLIAAMWAPPIGRVLPSLRRWLLAWGDVLMMRKQLRVLAALAARGPSRDG
ncbi:SRPBCC family protein [Georgenia wangjunii]|uniref:SRPBCC family protein n=1 Tax=Georgenia wangjunii TaxID=3117730 RepID=UPI002F26AFBC